jgi:hypothetical protein
LQKCRKKECQQSEQVGYLSIKLLFLDFKISFFRKTFIYFLEKFHNLSIRIRAIDSNSFHNPTGTFRDSPITHFQKETENLFEKLKERF